MDRSEETPAIRHQPTDSPTGAGFVVQGPAHRANGAQIHAATETPHTLHLAGNADERDGDDPNGRGGGDNARQDDSTSGQSGGDLGEALRLAERLTNVLRALEHRERAAYRLDAETMERIRRLEQSTQSIAAVHRALQERVNLQIDEGEFETLESLLNAWVERPNDLLVMVKLAERSTVLASVLNAFREIRQLLAEPDGGPGTGA